MAPSVPYPAALFVRSNKSALPEIIPLEGMERRAPPLLDQRLIGSRLSAGNATLADQTFCSICFSPHSGEPAAHKDLHVHPLRAWRSIYNSAKAG